MKRRYPFAAAAWDEVMDEEILHEVRKSPEGKIVDGMSGTIAKAFHHTRNNDVPEYSKIQSPALSIYVIAGSEYYLSPDYMTEEHKALVVEFYDIIRPALHRELIEQFRRAARCAEIVEIPNGHHNCFIKHEELVFDEMRKFLLP